MDSNGSRKHGPPRLAELLLRLTVRDADASDGMLGDLREEYRGLLGDGEAPRHPTLWFWLAVIGLSGRFLLAPAARVARLMARSPIDALRGRGRMMEILQDLKGGLRGMFRNPGVSGAGESRRRRCALDGARSPRAKRRGCGSRWRPG